MGRLGYRSPCQNSPEICHTALPRRVKPLWMLLYNSAQLIRQQIHYRWLRPLLIHSGKLCQDQPTNVNRIQRPSIFNSIVINNDKVAGGVCVFIFRVCVLWVGAGLKWSRQYLMHGLPPLTWDGRVCRLWLIICQLHHDIIRAPAVNVSLLSLGIKQDTQQFTC